ncbi:SSI family serine proteinase inhibitor [Streptomyces sp. NPDC050704]|uniref:SSI family serine proteinase inhibitor n=1 Tax=Streptomyces sp. NPDC050704 TaxID=3157219 RepID=UPI003435355C
MTKTTKAVRDVLLTACALLAAAAVPVQAQALAAPHGEIPGNWLYVTVTRGDARSSDTRGTLLLCDPPQGHAHAVRACEELRAANGDVGRIPPKDVFCPMIYAPVTASARGEWGGRPVTYKDTFSNSCVMAARTGAVFALSG